MFNLLTIHYGEKSDSKYYGIEIATFFTKKDGYGLFVILHEKDTGKTAIDFLWLSYFKSLIQRFAAWF
jgi:hypothetical protein